MRLPEFTPRADWTAPPLGTLPSWSGAQRVAIDIETRDPDLTRLGPGVRRGAYIVGVSFAIEDGPAAYLPIAHEGGGNVDRAHALAYLRDQARSFRGEVAGANLQYDLDFLAEAGVEFNPGRFRDVQIAEPLLDELQYSYSLESIAQRRGLPGKDEGHLRSAAAALGLDPKRDIWRIPAAHVGAYAEQDARLPLQLLRLQERAITDEDLWDVYDLECRLLPVLLKMRRRGIRVSLDELDRIEAWSIEEEDKALAELTRLTGIHLTRADTTRTAALLPLVRQIGVPIPMTEKGNPSLTGDFLETLSGPIGGLINRARKFNKLRGTFVRARREHAVNGRIHTTFNQLRTERPGRDDDGGARYGRCSSTDPNLQQEPARDPEVGPRWRRVYLPDEGGSLCSCDYSQQEPRWSVHFAEALSERGAQAAGDRYRRDPSTDNHDMMTIMVHGQASWDSWTKEERKHHRDRCKQIFLGLCYGMGEAKLCHDLGLPTEEVPDRRSGRMIEVAGPEGRALFDKFHDRVPFIRGASRRCASFAGRHGYVRTVLRRKCRFPERPFPGPRGERYDWAHKAFNRVIQGSSGDQTKKAMVDADAAGIRLQLQVHDELDLTIWSPDEARALADVMLRAVPCSVPHKVDIEVGPSWGELEKLK